MGKKKDTDKVVDIPHTGALKKLFDVVPDANIRGDTNVGKKYWLKRKFQTPRLWSLELQKLKGKNGYALRVVVNGTLPPATEVAYTTLPSITVSDIKVCGDNLILWVVNASGRVANLFFNDKEDKFEPKVFVDSVQQHAEAMKEYRSDPILPTTSVPNLQLGAVPKSRTLRLVWKALEDVNKTIITKANAEPSSRGRKRPPAPLVPCPPAASREKGGNRKKKEVVVAAAEEETVTADELHPSPEKDPEHRVEDMQTAQGDQDSTPEKQPVVGSEQLPTGTSSDEEEAALTRKRRKKVTSPNSRRTDVEVTPTTRKKLQKQFASDCRPGDVADKLPTRRTPKKKPLRHPKKVPEGKKIDLAVFQNELVEFKARSEPMYIWGQDFYREIDVDKMKLAPKELKYRPFHNSLVDNLVQLFMSSLHPVKQTLTLMPMASRKPVKFEEAQALPFYIINGQHSWAAANRLLDNPDVKDEIKAKYRSWTCDFVWSEDKLLLSELSRQTNNTNQFQWDSPEYLLHIEYARDLWVNFNRPTVADKKNWRMFQAKAVETLNAMTFRNAYKSFKEYPGEFRVICAADDLYNSIIKAFQWYESGDLVNPDTGLKWKDDGKDGWARKYTVAYTFKCIRGLESESLAELVSKITTGLDETGALKEDNEDVPKVYIGSNRPKNKFCFSLKEWTDRKKSKNAVVRWLNRNYPSELWADNDVNVELWRRFKNEKGFNSAHMDELIRRAGKKYLGKFMKASDNPKREQEPPPEEFLAEMNRVLEKDNYYRLEMSPIFGVFQKSGKLTGFANVRHVCEQTSPVKFDFDPSRWVSQSLEDMTFGGGIIDFRPIDDFLQTEDFEFNAFTGRTYEAFLQPLEKPRNLLTATESWMVIGHAISSKRIVEVMSAYMPECHVLQSSYFPAAAEKYFFSNTTLKKGNGVVVIIFTKKGSVPMKWSDILRSEERFKKVGYVREYAVHDNELRMEVYMDYISHLHKSALKQSVLCICGGRKPIIASLMYGLRPVTVVLGDEYLDPYLLCYKVGSEMIGFEHVFHTAKFTNDELGDMKETWFGAQPVVNPSSSKDMSEFIRETRTKLRRDRPQTDHENVVEVSEGTADQRPPTEYKTATVELSDDRSSSSNDGDGEVGGNDEGEGSQRSAPSSSAADEYYRASEREEGEREEGDRDHSSEGSPELDKLAAVSQRLFGSGDFLRALFMESLHRECPSPGCPVVSPVKGLIPEDPSVLGQGNKSQAYEKPASESPSVESLPQEDATENYLHEDNVMEEYPAEQSIHVENPVSRVPENLSPHFETPVDEIETPTFDSHLTRSPSRVGVMEETRGLAHEPPVSCSGSPPEESMVAPSPMHGVNDTGVCGGMDLESPEYRSFISALGNLLLREEGDDTAMLDVSEPTRRESVVLIEGAVHDSSVSPSPISPVLNCPLSGQEAAVLQSPNLPIPISPVVNCPLSGQEEAVREGQTSTEDVRIDEDCAMLDVIERTEEDHVTVIEVDVVEDAAAEVRAAKDAATEVGTIEVANAEVAAEKDVTAQVAVQVAAVEVAPVPPLVKVKVEKSVEVDLSEVTPLPSNQDNPIEIDSDEDDHSFREMAKKLRMEQSSASASVNDVKLTQEEALQIQLQKIGSKNIAINRETKRKNRELAERVEKMERMFERQQKRLEEAEATIRNAGLSQVISTGEDTCTPSAAIDMHATTSIASAPLLSKSRLTTTIPTAEDIIPATQESEVQEQHQALAANKVPKGCRARQDERYHHVQRVEPTSDVWIMHKRRKRSVNRQISDMESSSSLTWSRRKEN